MYAAGAAAAVFILENFSQQSRSGVAVYAGPGNNGGDAYVIASLLREAGLDVSINAIGLPKTDDAKRAALLLHRTRATTSSGTPSLTLRGGENMIAGPAREPLIIDGILGTGQKGALRETEREACATINRARHRGAVVIALDIPTGVDATTGEIAADAVRADHTLAFGTMKRACVLQREQVGAVTVFDIGLGEWANKSDSAWILAEPQLLSSVLPKIAWSAYKGTRGRIAIVGGAHGMAGAIMLASRAALRSGAGLVYAHVARESVLPLQIGVPQAVTRQWTDAPDNVKAAVIGPGFGRTGASERVLDEIINATHGVPTVIDADALTIIAGLNDSADKDLDEFLEPTTPGAGALSRLRAIALNRPLVITPHIGEFSRLIGEPAAAALSDRVAQAERLASATGACILLKGTPTIIVSPDNSPPLVVPRGTAVLATGGSGDVLSGIVGALLGQGAVPRDAAAIAAWIHGRAAEIATDASGSVRGVTLDEVLLAMAAAWSELSNVTPLSNSILARLPRL